MRPIFFRSCEDGEYYLTILRRGEPDYSLLEEFLHFIVNDCLFKYSKEPCSRSINVRLRYQVKFNVTVGN